MSLLVVVLSVLRTPAQRASVDEPKVAALELEGLGARVKVRRDGRGVPYIEAAAEEDLYFAQGFTTASDRLWQMNLLRRTGRGELSEIFGGATLEEDKRRRVYGFAALSERLLDNCSPPVRAALEAYARGVNAYIGTLDERSLPPEFQILGYKPGAWRPSDSLVIGKVFAETLSTSWPTDLMRASLSDLSPERRAALLPEISPLDVLLMGRDRPPKKSKAQASAERGGRNLAEGYDPHSLRRIVEVAERSLSRVGLYAEDLAASNNWVVSGKRTVTGKPLLANDPHLRPSAPSVWYMTSLSAPGLRVAGVTVPGVPGVVIGHNERIAWGVTNLGPDVQDLYREKFEPANPLRYMTPTGPLEAESRREEIKVRESFSGTATRTEVVSVTVTRHGPVVYENGGARFALRWTALDTRSVEFDAFYAINRARDWNGFVSALSRYSGPAQNFVYADAEGHIGYYGAGRIPLRRSGDGSVPYDGATDGGEWTGFIPFAELPHVRDPASGVIVTANNRVVGGDYPHHLTRQWAAPYRARRISDLLVAKKRLSVEDFRSIQADTFSFGDAIFAGEVVKLARPLASASPEWKAMLAAFDGWDGRSSAGSRVMPLAAAMRNSFRRRVLEAALGAERARAYDWANEDTFVDRLITTRPRAWLPAEFKTYEDLLLACYADARAELTKKLGGGESQWTWGRVATMRLPHALAAMPGVGARFALESMPQNATGSGSTVNMGASVSMRLIVDVSDWDKTRQSVAPGQSGNPSSPHWKDQVEDWYNVAPGNFPFSDGAVAAATKQLLTLTPKSK